MDTRLLIKELEKWIHVDDKRWFHKDGLIPYAIFPDFEDKFGNVTLKDTILKEVDSDGDRIYQKVYWFDRYKCYVVAEGYYTSDEGYFFDSLYISEPKIVKVVKWKKI